MEWIKVSERLPDVDGVDDDRRVFVYRPTRDPNHPMRFDCILRRSVATDKMVTHWAETSPPES